MKNEFNLELIEKSGHAKGLRDLEFCKKSELALALAIAEQILKIRGNLAEFVTHRLFLVEDFFKAEEGDRLLFEQVLVLGLAAKYLSIYATTNTLDLPQALLNHDHETNQKDHRLTFYRRTLFDFQEGLVSDLFNERTKNDEHSRFQREVEVMYTDFETAALNEMKLSKP